MDHKHRQPRGYGRGGRMEGVAMCATETARADHRERLRATATRPAKPYHGLGIEGRPTGERVTAEVARLILDCGSVAKAKAKAKRLAKRHRDADAVRFYSEVAACLG